LHPLMEAPVDFIPLVAQPRLRAFAPTFPQPPFQRWLPLCVAALVTPGRRTMSKLLGTGPLLVSGHPSSYQRAFSPRRWTLWGLSPAGASFLLPPWVPTGPVALAGDDTVEEPPGARCSAKPATAPPGALPKNCGRSWGWSRGVAGPRPRGGAPHPACLGSSRSLSCSTPHCPLATRGACRWGGG
jgi:hypothetical protein